MLSQNGMILYSTHGFVHPSIQVVQAQNLRYLRFGRHGGWQGALDVKRPNRPVFPYQRAFATVLGGVSQVDRFLSIGVGTGTSLRTMSRHFPGCELHGVELDETVLNVAIEYFRAPSHHQAQYWVGDGVQYLQRGMKQRYDVIFLDAYLSNKVFSASLEPSFTKVLYESLSPHGIVMANVIAGVPLKGAVRSFMDQAARQFARVWLIPVGFPFLEQNILAVFSKSGEWNPDWATFVNANADLNLLERVTWSWRIHRYAPNSERS